MYMYPIPNFFSCQVGVKIFGVQKGRKEIFPGGKFLWIEQMCDIMLHYKNGAEAKVWACTTDTENG